MMKADEDIRRDVEAELRFDPDIDANEIAVTVTDGVVTLAGFAHSYAQKWEAEPAAKRVAAVRGVANDIEVRRSTADSRPDPDIAHAAVNAIRKALPFSGDKITVTVRDRWITLEGEAGWDFLRKRAEAAVRRIRGLKGVVNLINLKPKVAPTQVQRQIEEALKRSAEVDAKNITVETGGDRVILRGQVRSSAEWRAAEPAAWRPTSVREGENRLSIKVWPMPWAGASRRWLELQRRGQGCFSL